MDDERRQVLQLLRDGKISTEQAMELLAALAPDDTTAESSPPPEPPPAYTDPSYYKESDTAVTGDILYPNSPPNMDSYRRFWQIPFFISLAFVTLFGLWLRAIYQSSAGAMTFGFICVWSFFMLSLLAALLAFLSKRAAWLHVRVQEKEGHRIAISLPLPLQPAKWGLRFASNFVDEATRTNLAMAAEFIDAAQESLRDENAEPMTIHVDDDDGDKVQVFIG
jgi:hypothetical protein